MQTRRMSNCYALLFLLAACASNPAIRRVQEFRETKDPRYLAPNARMYFEEKTGEGEPYTLSGGGRWDHWDKYFHSKTTMSNWRSERNAVTADVTETNDFMQMLDWRAKPYTMTWSLDDQGRIEAVLVKGNPEKPVSRLAEFKAWAREHHPDELAYLMPNDRLDPTGDRPERWRAILTEWIASKKAA